MTEVPSLEWRQLAVERGERALFKDLSGRIEAGESMLVEGPNGSGKTTFLRSIAGLYLPLEGEFLWAGESINELGETFRENLLYLGHMNAIKGNLDAVENLRVQCRLSGDAVSDDDIWSALAAFGLRGFEDFPTRMLSQGQKRRVALARLLLSRAKLWVLDEPFVALDVAAVDHLQSVISAHVEAGGMAILTTHQATRLTDNVTHKLRLGS